MTRLFAAALAAGLFALPAAADTLSVTEPYALSSNPRSAAAFLTVENHGAAPDRLVAVRADIARRVELHTHEIRDGIARMIEVEAIEVPAGGVAVLERGGDHVMFLGLAEPLQPGGSFPLTLVFESGAEITVDVPFRDAAGARPAHGGGHGHGGHHRATD